MAWIGEVFTSVIVCITPVVFFLKGHRYMAQTTKLGKLLSKLVENDSQRNQEWWKNGSETCFQQWGRPSLCVYCHSFMEVSIARTIFTSWGFAPILIDYLFIYLFNYIEQPFFFFFLKCGLPFTGTCFLWQRDNHCKSECGIVMVKSLWGIIRTNSTM